MRQDIQKVLVERQRRNDPYENESRPGERTKARKQVRRLHLDPVDYGEGETLDDQTALKKGSMSRFAKDLTDRLGALRGWARKQVGRPYNIAMRDVHRLLQGNGVQQAHVRQHIDNFIVPSNKVQIVDGRAFYAAHAGGTEISDIELYADPRDGVIKWGKGRARHFSQRDLRSSPRNQQLRVLPAQDGATIPLPDLSWGWSRFFIRKNGVWYHSYVTERTETDIFGKTKVVLHRVEIQASRDRLRTEGFRPRSRRR